MASELGQKEAGQALAIPLKRLLSMLRKDPRAQGPLSISQCRCQASSEC